jgi:DNA-binding NarL/FixJ family response regulator
VSVGSRAHRPRVVVCDSSEIIRIGVRNGLTAQGVEVVAEAEDTDAALALIETPTEAFLIDTDLRPSADRALELMGTVSEKGHTVLATSNEAAHRQVLNALGAGAAGFLTKDMSAESWADAIRAAIRGELAVSRAIAHVVLGELRATRRTRPLTELLPSERRLTRREWEVLAAIAEGKTNRTVAAELYVSTETVRTHVSHILAKLEAPNRSAAAAMFRELEAAQSG